MNIKFKDTAHEDFFLQMLHKSGVNDSYHRAFFYVMGISRETQKYIGQMFDFEQDCIRLAGMRGGWQTSGTVRICHLAFNLWNGHSGTKNKGDYTPNELFACSYAPYFMEGIKLRYPEHCRELSNTPKHTEPER